MSGRSLVVSSALGAAVTLGCPGQRRPDPRWAAVAPAAGTQPAPPSGTTPASREERLAAELATRRARVVELDARFRVGFGGVLRRLRNRSLRLAWMALAIALIPAIVIASLAISAWV